MEARVFLAMLLCFNSFSVSDDHVYGLSSGDMFMNATARKAEFDPTRQEQIKPKQRSTLTFLFTINRSFFFSHCVLICYFYYYLHLFYPPI